MFDLTTRHPEDDRSALDPIDESHFAGHAPEGEPLRPPDAAWVEATLASLTLEEKAGQLLVCHEHERGEELIAECKAGGFVFLGNGQHAEEIVATVNRLQDRTRVPLWFAIDAEAGVGARVSDATIYPLIMAFGAANDPELTELCGRITARESRALGLQVAYGPVVDVNTEPRNPIISTRAYSDQVERVVELARAFIRGARAEGVLTTLKHFPGHGATARDSHHELPAVHASPEELEAHHLRPFRELIGGGDVDLVMTGHVWYPEAHPEPWPATLSRHFNTDVLRGDIGYGGVLVSDAYNMSGLTSAFPEEGERAVLGIEAGVDAIVVPGDPKAAFRAILEAVRSGRLTEERLDASVRRILAAKSRAGLPERRHAAAGQYRSVLNHPEHRAAVERLCREAFTEVRNDLAPRPAIAAGERVLALTLEGQRRIFYRFGSGFTLDPLRPHVAELENVEVGIEVPEELRAVIMEKARRADKVLVLGYDWYEIQSPAQVDLINALAEADVPVVYTSFGSPYHLSQVPGVAAFFCGYASVPPMQRVAVEVLLGEFKAAGELPVSLPVS